MNPAFPPLDNVKVRQALSYAVPYDRILEDVYNGMARPSHGPVSDAAAGVNPSLFQYTFDLDKARTLLAEAGFGDGFSTWFGYPTTDPVGELVGIQLQTAFAQIGVDLELRAMPSALYTEAVFGGQAPLIFFNLGADSPDPNYALRVFYESTSTNNWGGYENPDFDECVKEGANIQDWNERLAFHEGCTKILIDDAGWLWMAQPGFQLATRDDVTNINWYDGESVDWSIVEFSE